MKTTTREERLAKLSRELRRAYEASEAGDHAEALGLYQGVLERSRAMGIESGFVLWNLAIVCDHLGELEKAFHHIEQALASDPLAQPFRNSFDVITGRIRNALADESRAADDPSTPRLYDLLVGACAADVSSHVAMARFCTAKGDLDRAWRIADALVVLHAGEPVAWRCKADVARVRGEVAIADECLAEAAVRGGAPEPFAVPGVARG
jgi:tetratricopeptide (TPR) repeat protein